MNIKQVLAKSFTLMFREHQLTEKNSFTNKDFILSVLRKFTIEDDGIGIDREAEQLNNVRDVIIKLCQTNITKPSELSTFVQDFRIACGDDEVLYESVKESIIKDLSQDELLEVCISIRRSIQSLMQEDEIKDIISKAAAQLKYKSYEIDDVKKYISELNSQLMVFTEKQEEEVDPAIISEIDVKNKDGIEEVLRNIQDESSGKTIIKTPWQSINRMIRGGLRRGQSTCVAALQHKNKTGFCLAMAIGAALYNDPKDILNDKTKKPLIVYISLEDDMDRVIGTTYSILKENIDNEKVDDNVLANLSLDETQSYIQSKISANGWDFKMMRVNPSAWTYMDFINQIVKYQMQNYEVVLTVIDYLNMLPKTGCEGSNEADRIQNLFLRVRNFFSAENIALVTPHQLSSEALELERQGVTDFTQRMSTGNYYAGSKGIGRELDLELFIHIVKDSGRSYQFVSRGKHRVIGNTKLEYLNTILPFEDIGGLRFDVDKGLEGDTSISKIGQKRGQNGEIENPFWE